MDAAAGQSGKEYAHSNDRCRYKIIPEVPQEKNRSIADGEEHSAHQRPSIGRAKSTIPAPADDSQRNEEHDEKREQFYPSMEKRSYPTIGLGTHTCVLDPKVRSGRRIRPVVGSELSRTGWED